jgi:hypothetical protein
MRRILNPLALIAAAGILAAGAASAQNLTASTTTANMGQVDHASTVSYTPGADSGSFDFDLRYDAARLTTTTPEVTGSIPGGTLNCNVPAAGQILCTATANSAAVDLGAGTITILFDVGTTLGVTPLTFMAANFFDQGGGTEPGTTTNGQVTVNSGPQPALSSVPAPASTITINDIVGGGATTGTLTITNSGQALSTLNVGAPTGLSGVLSIAPSTAQAIAQGSAGTAYTISCTAAAVGTTSQVLSFTHDGTSPGSPVTYNVDCVGVAGPTAPTASLGTVTQPSAGVINQTATGSVPVNVDSAGVATASLALTCTIPATGASAFAITGGGSRTITAPATVGANAPNIGVSCVRQAAAVSATLSCAQNATPDPDPAALTAMITCPAGTTAPNFASTPSPGGTINATGVTGDTVVGTLAVSNAAGTQALNVSNCTASAGFTVTTAMPLTIPAGANSSVSVSCVAPAPGVTNTGTLTCDHDAPNAASPVSYNLACTGVSGVIPTMGNAGKILLVSLMIGLGLLGMALRRQA